MSELVFLQGDEPVTTSLKVAEYMQKQHKHVIRTIETVITDYEEMASASQSPKVGDGVNTPIFQKATYQTEEDGRWYPMYLLNRKAFTLVAMRFTGKKAMKFQSDFYDAFEAMRRELERRTEDFPAARQIAVFNTKHLHKVIDEVIIPIARANGSKTPTKWFHSHYEKLINKILNIPAGQRPKLPFGLQSDIARLDEVVETSIIKQAQAGATHREIYSGTKNTVSAYAQVALFAERIPLPSVVIKAKKISSATRQLSLF